MENIIEILDLNKSYGEVKAVQDLSFCVKKGELFAFLGVNGAGKSTTINIIFGQAFEKRLFELAEILSFTDLINRPVGKLSGGQRRKIDIARALLHHPKILILDEPTTGLDPQTRKHLWNVISYLRVAENLTVFLTTHYMEEAVDSDYVVIIDGGKISAKGTPLELKNAHTGDCIILYGISENKVENLGVKYKVFKDCVKIFVKDTASATNLILAHPELFTDYEIIKGNMDDVFLNVTGKKIEGGAN